MTTYASDTSKKTKTKTAAPDPAVVDAVIEDQSTPDEDDAPVAPDGEASEAAADDGDEDSDEDTGWKHPEPDEWKHDWLEFHGDLLAIRVPAGAAITGYQVSQSSTNSYEFQLSATNRFITRHMSPESYARVIDRMMDPDEEDYTEETIGELIDAVAKPGVDRLRKSAEERAKVIKASK